MDDKHQSILDNLAVSADFDAICHPSLHTTDQSPDDDPDRQWLP